MQQRKKGSLIRMLLMCAIGLWASLSPGKGISEDFESANTLDNWDISGDMKLKAVSGIWQTVTAYFNSRENTKVLIYLASMPSSLGRIQFDNVRFEPAVTVKNADFEEDGGWSFMNAHFDGQEMSHGKRSVYGEFKLDTAPAIDVRQVVEVRPNTQYKMNVDVLVRDNFEGEAKVLIFDKGGMHCLVENWDDVQLSRFCTVRDSNGRNVLEMHAEKGEDASARRVVEIGKSEGCYRVRFSADTTQFAGNLEVQIRNGVNGQPIATIGVENGKKWHDVKSDMRLPSKVELVLKASGTGIVLLDNLSIGNPEVIPALQQVDWLNGFYRVENGLAIYVDSGSFDTLSGALEILNEDLKPLKCSARLGDRNTANVHVHIGEKYALANHAEEGYRMAVEPDKGVIIEAGTPSGAFYGLMTLLQLVTAVNGQPTLFCCRITDYPDMPMRGMLYGDIKKCARYKMNYYMYSSGLTDPSDATYRADLLTHRKFNMKTIPMFLSFMTHNGVAKVNPSAICGIEVKDEKIRLSGQKSTALAHQFVVRSKLSDIVVKSSSGNVYEEGRDYVVKNGVVPANFKKESGSTDFEIVRTADSRIGDGEEVLVSYDYVSHVRGDRFDEHIIYCPFEPDARKFMDCYLEKVMREVPCDYVNVCNDLFEFWPSALQLETDSRIRKSGKTIAEIYLYEMEKEVGAARKGNARKKLMIYTGSNNELAKQVAPKLDKSVIPIIWGYDANWVDAYGREAMELWSGLGHETCLMPWSNLRNIRSYSQLYKYAREKGYPCLGIIGSAWGNRDGGLVETANVSWRIPKPGDKNYVKLH